MCPKNKTDFLTRYYLLSIHFPAYLLIKKEDILYKDGVYQYKIKGLQPNTSYFGYVVFKTSSEEYRKFPINFTTDISNKKVPSKKKDSSLVGVSW